LSKCQVIADIHTHTPLKQLQQHGLHSLDTGTHAGKIVSGRQMLPGKVSKGQSMHL
jgi:hypothetical protein